MPRKRKPIRAVIALPGEDAQTKMVNGEYEGVRSIIGGPFTVMALAPGVTAYLHDEALLIGLPWNRVLNGQPLAGPILVVGGPDRRGYDTSLTEAMAERVVLALNTRVPRLPPVPSSIEALETMTDRPASSFQTFDAKTGELVIEEFWQTRPPTTRRIPCPKDHPLYEERKEKKS